MKQTLQHLLAEGKTAQVIAELRKLNLADKDLTQAILQTAARFADLERQQHAGTLAHEALSLERNKINAALLHLIGQLPDDEVLKRTSTAKVDAAQTEEPTYQGNQYPKTMADKSQRAIILTVLIAFFGVLIGFLGELMPDNFKNSIENWTTAHTGMSYLKVWLIITAIVVFSFIVLVWKEALNKDKEVPSAGNTSRKVTQGPKSVYIEKNKGDIHIN